MCAISTVQKPRKDDDLRIFATNTKRSIIDIPVTISGFIIGICVADIVTFFICLFLILEMPYAAAVPIIVEISDDKIAKMSVFLSAFNVAVSVNT